MITQVSPSFQRLFMCLLLSLKTRFSFYIFCHIGYWTRVKATYVTNYLEQASTEHFPNFSWDKVPRWISFRKNPNQGPFTDEEINR